MMELQLKVMSPSPGYIELLMGADGGRANVSFSVPTHPFHSTLALGVGGRPGSCCEGRTPGMGL